ncbi:MAG: phosphatase PAP2 family protein [Pseudomonadota bacterium]
MVRRIPLWWWVAATAAVVFSLWPQIDLRISGMAYEPGSGFVGNRHLVIRVIYDSARWLTIAALLLGLVLLAGSFVKRWIDPQGADRGSPPGEREAGASPPGGGLPRAVGLTDLSGSRRPYPEGASGTDAGRVGGEGSTNRDSSQANAKLAQARPKGGRPWMVGIRGRWPRRGIGAFLLLSLLLGPGLMVNGVLKEHWGRARPHQVVDFGGQKPFTPALQPADNCASNCSFVSGHSAIGFWWLALGLAWPAWRWRALLLGVGLGGMLGLARIMQGGHFTSDVVFSFLVVWGTAELLAWIFRRKGWLSSPAP